MLVVTVILLIVIGAVFGVWQGLARTYAFAEDDTTAQAQARMAMAEMVEYIRTARQPASPPSESLDAVITEAGPFSLTLWTDTVRDGSHSLQLIRFRVAPDPSVTQPPGTHFELWREEGDAGSGVFDNPPVRLITADVDNSSSLYPLFEYRDSLGAATTDVAKIREVQINLRIDVDPNRSPATNVLTSIVQPRNLRQ